MLKQDELSNFASCLNRAAFDEPLFVLRAKDRISPIVIRMWAKIADRCNFHEPWKIKEALAIAAQMEQWRKENVLPRSI